MMADDCPPNYEDVVHGGSKSNIDPAPACPSAPLLNDENTSAPPPITSLENTIHLPDNLKFSIGKSSEVHYGFFIRDQMELLVAKGAVLGRGRNGDIITVDSPTDITFLELFSEKDIIHEYPNMIFTVNHLNFLLGSTTINGNNLGGLSVKNNFGKSIYKVVTHKYQESADIIVTRDGITVSRVHIKNASQNTSNLSFEASVSFSSCNSIEKCLLISVAIAYMVCKNKLSQGTAAGTSYNFATPNTGTGTGTSYNFSTNTTATAGTGASNSNTAFTTYFNNQIQLGNQTENTDDSGWEDNPCLICLGALFMLAVIGGVIYVIMNAAGAFEPRCVRQGYKCT